MHGGVKWWRLWRLLFRCHYANVSLYDKADKKAKAAIGGVVLRVRELPTQEKYVLWKGECRTLDTLTHYTPLTWVDKKDAFDKFAKLIEKKLTED